MSELAETEETNDEREPWSFCLSPSLVVTKAIWVPLGVALLYVVAIFLMGPMRMEKNTNYSPFIAAVIMFHMLFLPVSFAAVCAMWMSLTHYEFKWRFLLGLLAIMVFSLSALPSSPSGWRILIAVAVSFFLFWTITASLRRWRDWRMLRIAYSNTNSYRNIGFSRICLVLIILSLLASLILLVVKLPQDNFDLSNPEILYCLGLLTIFNHFLPIWIALVLPLTASVNLSSIALIVIFSWIAYVVSWISRVLDPEALLENFLRSGLPFTLGTSTALVLCTFFSSLALRWAGYRIVRQTDSAPSGEPHLSSS